MTSSNSSPRSHPVKIMNSVKVMMSVKWDDQTANQFISLRTSLQHALIDSSTTTLAATASNTTTTTTKVDHPFSPTRVSSATIGAPHYYARSYSEGAALTNSTTTATKVVEMMPQNNYNTTNNSGSRGNNAKSSASKRSIIPNNNNGGGGGNTTAGGVFPFARSKSTPLPPDNVGGGVEGRGRGVTSNNGGHPSKKSNHHHQSQQQQQQQQLLVGKNNEMEELALLDKDNALPSPHYQFHINAIQALLSDTPLPLAIQTSLSDYSTFNRSSGGTTRTMVQPRQPNFNEHVYLLPRMYMRKWCDWTRNDVILSCVDEWVLSSLSLPIEALNTNNGGSISSSNDAGTREVLFELPQHAVQTLAALSIISDQYQLYTNVDDDDNDNGTTRNDKEWMKWLDSVQTCWMDWMTCVNERGWLQQQQQQQQVAPSSTNDTNNNDDDDDGGILHDEKKEDVGTNIHHHNHHHHHQTTTEGMMQASQLFRDMFEMLHPSCCPPGAIDARMMIRKNKSLQLRRNVSLVMRGLLINNATTTTDSNNSNNNGSSSDGNRNENILTVQQEMDDEALINYLDSSETDEDAPHLAVNPVPSSFYELLRQTVGVICEDNRTISYQSSSVAIKNGGGDEDEDGMSLLYHDQWRNDPSPLPSSSSPRSSPRSSLKKNMDINYPSLSTEGGTMTMMTNNAVVNNSQSKSSAQAAAAVARPIEFRRRLLATSSSLSSGVVGQSAVATKSGTTAASSPSYASLLKEATQSMRESQIIGNNQQQQQTMNSVEVYPVEFHYSIIDGVSSPLPPAAVVNTNSLRHCQQGMALASRASLAKNVLHELERAASPGRSSACIRLWKKSRPYVNDVQAAEGIRGATKNGDGFDLIHMDSLVVSPPKKPKSPKSPPRSGKKSNDNRPLTVGEWLKIDLTQLPQSQPKIQPVVVELLIEIRSSPTARWVRESLQLENRLQVGDFVDAQDSTRQWYEAIIREVTPDTVKVHYFGWGSKWDTILPRHKKGGAGDGKLKSKSPPLPLWSKTSRWREQIKVGDEVEVRESSSLVQRPKWHRATVLAVGREVDPPRELVGGAELEALEDNGDGKMSSLLLLNRKRQILVEVPQERLRCTSPLPTVRSKNDDGLPAAQPPFIRWVNLYGEEICQVNTHQTRDKKQSDAPATASYVMESKRDLVEVMKPFNNIHGSGFVRESLRGNPIASGTVGLHNLGNSCYMNSILQCLNQMKPITNFFLKGEYLKEINKNNPLGSGGRISTAYASFLNDVWGNEYSILAPRLLKQTVGSFAPQFNNNFQHDSQEFCQFLIDGLHEDLNRVKNKPYVEQFEAYGMEDRLAAEESWRNHLKRHDSIFVDYTQGMHRSHLRCPGCGRESVKFDVYSSISIPLVPPKSGSTIPLKDCLDQFAAGEQLDEHNAWYCSNCKKHVCALKLITLWNTPDILVLHLKRFTFEKCPDVDGRILKRKIEDTVNFPIDRLDMTEYVRGPIDPNAPPIYKLFGVSEHSGTTANSGHYTATARNSEDGNWYRYNDSNVGFTSGDAAITGGAYLLFYQRSKGSLRWAGMEKELSGSVTPSVDEDGFQAVVGKKKKNRR